ncbi:MAG: hypothetical protein ACKVX7_14430 [Planctomycetota bacterium]
MAHDVAIPIVFPDYVISVPRDMIVQVPSKKFDLPSALNRLGIPDFSTPKLESPTTVPDAGHAGVLFINGANGLSRYYEYGRYDPSEVGVRPTSPPVAGLVRKRGVPDVKLLHGEITPDSLKATLRAISKSAGYGGRIAAAYIEVPKKFAAMEAYAIKRARQNTDAKRDPYSITSNSCVHFMIGTVEAAGVNLPRMYDPRPKSYIEKTRASFRPLDYEPAGDKMILAPL